MKNEKKKKKRNTKNIKQKAWNYIMQAFFFTRLVCEMIATGTYWFFFNGRGCCDHKWVKHFVRLMYTKQISIHHFNIISSNLLSPWYSWQIDVKQQPLSHSLCCLINHCFVSTFPVMKCIINHCFVSTFPVMKYILHIFYSLQ
jgi:hypothetical protein